MVVFFKPEGSGKSIKLTLAFLKSNTTSVRNKYFWLVMLDAGGSVEEIRYIF